MASQLKISSKRAKVLEVDPDSTKLRFIQNTARLSDLDSFVDTVHCALGDSTSSGALDKSMHAGAWYVKDGSDFSIVPLDDIVRDKAIKAIFLIKLDVEGHEVKALQGARNVIAHHKPHIMIEVSDRQLARQGHSKSDIYRFMQSMGYEEVWSGDLDVLFTHKRARSAGRGRLLTPCVFAVLVICLAAVLLGWRSAMNHFETKQRQQRPENKD